MCIVWYLHPSHLNNISGNETLFKYSNEGSTVSKTENGPLSISSVFLLYSHRLLLTSSDVKILIKAYSFIRDKGLVKLLADPPLPRCEAVSMNWDVIGISNGLVIVSRGKGVKTRSVVAGAQARWILDSTHKYNYICVCLNGTLNSNVRKIIKGILSDSVEL